MSGADGDRPRRRSFRIFPTESKSTRGEFAKFIEESGTNFFLATAIAELFDLPNKPENAIEWFRLYFKQLASKRTDEITEDQNTLKKAILKQESTLVRLRMEQHHLEVQLDELYYEAKHVHTIPPKPSYDEDFRRYRNVVDDPRWRIRPDPDVVVFKKDILVQAMENDGKSKSRLNVEPSFSLQLQDAQDTWASSSLLSVEAKTNREDYKDYPKLYFGIDEAEIGALPTDEDEELENDEASILEEQVRKISGATTMDEADQIQLNALLAGMDGESADEGEEEMILREDEEDEDPEEDEHFGALKSGRSGKRSAEPGAGEKLTETPLSSTPSKSKRKGDKSGTDDKQGKGEKQVKDETAKAKGDKPEKGSKKKGKKGKSKIVVDEGGGGDFQTIPNDPSLVPPTESEVSTKSGKHGKKGKKGKKKNRKAELEEEGEEDVVVSMPVDPLTLELRPVTPSFWKEDFSLTKGHEKMFDFNDADEFGYEDLDMLDMEEVQETPPSSGVYSDSRGEKRTRRFQSQIIHDAFFKPDRGASVEFDTQFEPLESPNPSTTVLPSEGVEISGAKSPSVVTATISDGTIEARLSKDKSHTKIDEFRAMMERDKKMSHRFSHK